MTNFIFSKKIKITLVIIFFCYTIKSNAIESNKYLWTKLFVFDDYEVLKSRNCNSLRYTKQVLDFDEVKNIKLIEKVKNNLNFYVKKKNIIFDHKHYDKILKKISINKQLLNNQYLKFEFENIDDLDFINFKSKHKISTFKTFNYFQNAILINYKSTTKLENIYLYSFKPIKNLKISILTFDDENFFLADKSEKKIKITNCYRNLETIYYGENYHLKMQREVIDYLKLNSFLFYGSHESIVLKKNMHTLHDLISFYDFTKINKKKVFINDFNDDLYLRFELKGHNLLNQNIKYFIDESNKTYNIESLTVNLKELLEKNNEHNLNKKSFEMNILSNDISRVYLFKKVELRKLSDIQELRTIFDKDVSDIKDKQYFEKKNILALKKKLKIKSKIPDF